MSDAESPQTHGRGRVARKQSRKDKKAAAQRNDYLRINRLFANQCRSYGNNKFCMPTFLQGLITCAVMSREQQQTNPLTIYHCLKCGSAHIGHLSEGESILMYGPWAENVRELQL